MNIKDTILLKDDEAKKLLSGEVNADIDVYFLNTQNSFLMLLKPGDLEQIRRAIPHRVEVIWASAPIGTGIPYFDRVGYQDLRISKSMYDKNFKKGIGETSLPSNHELLNNSYYSQLTTMAKQAIGEYIQWRSKNAIKKNMISQVVEPLLKSITSDDREIEFLKRILKSEFQEL